MNTRQLQEIVRKHVRKRVRKLAFPSRTNSLDVPVRVFDSIPHVLQDEPLLPFERHHYRTIALVLDSLLFYICLH